MSKKPIQKIEVKDPYGYVGYLGGAAGMFVTISDDSNIKWSGRCRVEFEQNWSHTKFHNRVGFIKQSLDIKLANEFWNKIFRKLGKSSKFTICESNFPNVYVIDLPKFWCGNDTARSLFSLLLRASASYHKKGNTIVETLQAYELANKALPAIEWFLKGNTIPTYEKLTKLDWEGYTGFIAEFQNLTQAEIEAKLVKTK